MMRKKEIVALVAIPVVLAVLALAFLFPPEALWNMVQIQALSREYDTEYDMGETVALDAEKDREAVSPSFLWFEPVVYDAGLDYTGTLELTVEDAVLYRDIADTGLSSTDPFFSGANLFYEEPYVQEQFSLLICRIRLHNVDAAPASYSAPRTHPDRPQFKMSGIVRLDPDGQPAYFDGTSAPEELGSGGYFDLAPGETREYLIGYAVTPQQVEDGDFALYAGVMDDRTTKYRIPLTVTEGKEEL